MEETVAKLDGKAYAELSEALQSNDLKKLATLRGTTLENLPKECIKVLHGTKYIQFSDENKIASVLLNPERVEKDLGNLFNFDSFHEGKKWIRVCNGLEYKLEDINRNIAPEVIGMKANKKEAKVIFCGELSKYCERSKNDVKLIEVGSKIPVHCHYYNIKTKRYKYIGTFKGMDHMVVPVKVENSHMEPPIKVGVDVFIFSEKAKK